MEEFKVLYDEYKGRVYYFVKKYIKRDEEAEDVVQEIFIHAWKHFEKIKHSPHPEAILFKASKQEIANFYRRNKLSFSEFTGDVAEEAEEESREEELARLEQLVNQLPERRKDILLKNKTGGQSYARIASENGISKTAVEKQINKAIRFIKNNFR